MDILANLAMGFSIALSPYTLMLAVLGCFIGTIVGALPGLGPSNGVAILIPITFTIAIVALRSTRARRSRSKAQTAEAAA